MYAIYYLAKKDTLVYLSRQRVTEALARRIDDGQRRIAACRRPTMSRGIAVLPRPIEEYLTHLRRLVDRNPARARIVLQKLIGEIMLQPNAKVSWRLCLETFREFWGSHRTVMRLVPGRASRIVPSYRAQVGWLLPADLRRGSRISHPREMGIITAGAPCHVSRWRPAPPREPSRTSAQYGCVRF